MDWVALITHNLRYVPRLDQETGERSFFDNWTKQKWMTAIPPDKPYVTLDYGLVCRISDTDTGQIVFLADGLYTFGTGGAAMLLFVPRLFSELVKTAPAGWELKNFQAIVRVSVVGTAISEPQVVAAHFW